MAQANIVTIPIREGTAPPFAHPTTAVQQQHAHLVATLAALKPPRILNLSATAEEIEARGEHLDQLFRAVAGYVGFTAAETAEYASRKLDLEYIAGFLCDAGAEVRCEFARCAEGIQENHAPADGRV